MTGGSVAGPQQAPIRDAPELAGDAFGAEPTEEHALYGLAATAVACAPRPNRSQLAKRTPAAKVTRAAEPHTIRDERERRRDPTRIGMVGTDPAPGRAGARGRGGATAETGGRGGSGGTRRAVVDEGHDMGRGARSDGSRASVSSTSALGAGRSVTAEGEWRVAIRAQCHSLRDNGERFRARLRGTNGALAPPESSVSVVSARAFAAPAPGAAASKSSCGFDAGASSGFGRSPRDKTRAPPARDSERNRRRGLLVSRRRCPRAEESSS
jgi:hypothetical protein